MSALGCRQLVPKGSRIRLRTQALTRFHYVTCITHIGSHVARKTPAPVNQRARRSRPLVVPVWLRAPAGASGGAQLSHSVLVPSLSRMSDSDAALVARTLAGDLDAYAALMARYRDAFGRYALHMLGNREDAQEAIQDSFVRAYGSLAKCREPERFAAWLFRIVVNRCRTARRRLLRYRRFDADLPHDVASNGAQPDAFEWRGRNARGLAPLWPPPRGALMLRYV